MSKLDRYLKPKQPVKPLQVKLDRELYDQVYAVAEKLGVSAKAVVEAALRSMFDDIKTKKEGK